MSPTPLSITGNAPANDLLNSNGTALLIGMLLDQQIPIEWAFQGPFTLQQRLGHLDAARISALAVEELVELACRKPAVHRFPAAMARRIHELCVALVRDHGGDGRNVWSPSPATGGDLYARLRALPGFGDEKAKILIAVLAKRYGVQPPGWAAAAGVFADDAPRSVADIDGPEALARVRQWKTAQKAAGKDKQDRALR